MLLVEIKKKIRQKIQLTRELHLSLPVIQCFVEIESVCMIDTTGIS